MSNYGAADAADLGAFIPSGLDDYPLLDYEFRIYGHVVRRIGKDGCFASHQKMAKHCRMRMPKFLNGIDFLVSANLLIRQPPKEPGGTYTYVRTNEKDWVPPEEAEALRQQITEKRKDKRSFADRITYPRSETIYGSEAIGGLDRRRSGGWIGGDRGVGSETIDKGTNIKGIPLRESHEGDLVPSQARGHGCAPSQEPELEQPETPPTSVNKAEEPCTAAKPGSGGKVSAAAKKAKAKAQKAEKVYAQIQDREGFEAFWGWYKDDICPIRASQKDRGAASPGKKVEAAEAWVELESLDFLDQGREGFRKGCKLQWQQYLKTGGGDIPHACRFLYPGSGEPEWLNRLQEQTAEKPQQKFIESAPAVGGASPAAGIHQQIGAELRRLDRPAVLPDKWQDKTGASVVSELNEDDARAYLIFLQGLEVCHAS
jgi:hypothetical protein